MSVSPQTGQSDGEGRESGRLLQWNELLKIIITLICLTAGLGVTSTLFPAFLDGLGYPVSMIGVLVSLFSIAAFLSRLPTGLVYRGRRAIGLMHLFLALFATSTALYPVATAPLLLWSVRFMNGLSYGVATTVNFAMYMDAIPPTVSRHRALALYSSGIATGHFLGNAVGGYIADLFGMTTAFGVTALFPVIGILCTLGIRLPPTPAHGATGVREASSRQGQAGSFLDRIHRLGAILLDPQVVAVALVGFFLNLFFNLGTTYVTLYALGVGFTLGQIGVIKGALSLTNVIARPFSGDLANRVGEGWISNISLVGTAALLMLIPSVVTLWPMIVLFVALGIMRAAVLVANTVSASRLGETKMSRGMASGLYNAATDLGSIIGPIYGGVIAAQVGLVKMFWLSPGLALVVYFLVLWGSSRRRQRGEATP